MTQHAIVASVNTYTSPMMR